MKTAEQYWKDQNKIVSDKTGYDYPRLVIAKKRFLYAINVARKEAIEQCAEKAQAYRGDVDKQSILKLIDELK